MCIEAGRWIALVLAILVPIATAQARGGADDGPNSRLRLIVETDAGGDPDDEQSLVRFLLYANEWDVEAILANRPVAKPKENLNPVRDGLGIIRRLLDAYGEVAARLREHDPRFPDRQTLWDRTVSGYADSDDGVDRVIAAADADDPRPIWFMNWGSDPRGAPSCLKRALDKVRAERGPDGYARFKDKFRLSSSDRFGDHTTTIPPAWRLWVYSSNPKLDGGFWYRRFGPLTSRAGGFDLHRDVLTGHGPLGALYPTNTDTPQKEGDSLLFVYLIPTGMNDPTHPEWGSWAGRFGIREDIQPPQPTYFWANVRDTWNGSTHRDNTLKRWAADLQDDFRARMDWCVQPFDKANHAPVPALSGDPSRAVPVITARPGESVSLSARGSTDPDGDPLTYEWTAYPEAGTYPRAFSIAHETTPEARLAIPDDAEGTDLHVILTVRDHGDPPLARYRRVILRVPTVDE